MHWYALLNAYPYTNGHLMLVLGRHHEGFEGLEPDEAAELAPALARCEAAVRAAYAPHGINVGVNLGRAAGAGASCASCHPPEGAEFGPSVAGAHSYPGFSRQLPGVVFDIVKIDGGRPGESPTVTFTVKNKKGEPIDAAKMPNLRLVLAWPTTDYKVAVEEDVRKGPPLRGGSYSYKFRYVVPADAGGSGAVGIQGFMPVDLTKPNGDVIKAVNDVGFNVVKYFPITDAQAMPRRQLVKRENCNSCHMSLATHGEARRNPEYCVMCHHPAQTDGEKRKTAKGPMPPENIHFKRLIHRLHTGAELREPFIIYGGFPAKPGPVEFGDIRFRWKECFLLSSSNQKNMEQGRQLS